MACLPACLLVPGTLCDDHKYLTIHHPQTLLTSSPTFSLSPLPCPFVYQLQLLLEKLDIVPFFSSFIIISVHYDNQHHQTTSSCIVPATSTAPSAPPLLSPPLQRRPPAGKKSRDTSSPSGTAVLDDHDYNHDLPCTPIPRSSLANRPVIASCPSLASIQSASLRHFSALPRQSPTTTNENLRQDHTNPRPRPRRILLGIRYPSGSPCLSVWPVLPVWSACVVVQTPTPTSIHSTTTRATPTCISLAPARLPPHLADDVVTLCPTQRHPHSLGFPPPQIDRLGAALAPAPAPRARRHILPSSCLFAAPLLHPRQPLPRRPSYALYGRLFWQLELPGPASLLLLLLPRPSLSACLPV